MLAGPGYPNIDEEEGGGELEFTPLYQYYSPNGFKQYLPKRQTSDKERMIKQSNIVPRFNLDASPGSASGYGNPHDTSGLTDEDLRFVNDLGDDEDPDGNLDNMPPADLFYNSTSNNFLDVNRSSRGVSNVSDGFFSGIFTDLPGRYRSKSQGAAIFNLNQAMEVKDEDLMFPYNNMGKRGADHESLDYLGLIAGDSSVNLYDNGTYSASAFQLPTPGPSSFGQNNSYNNANLNSYNSGSTTQAFDYDSFQVDNDNFNNGFDFKMEDNRTLTNSRPTSSRNTPSPYASKVPFNLQLSSVDQSMRAKPVTAKEIKEARNDALKNADFFLNVNENSAPSCTTPTSADNARRLSSNSKEPHADPLGDNVLYFESRFLKKYWRNDRKNIQCFPNCPEFGDYYTSRINNETHTRSGGTCTSSVVAKLRSNFDSPNRLIAIGRIALHNHQVEQSFNFNHDINNHCSRLMSRAEYDELKKNSVIGDIEESTNGLKTLTFTVQVWKLNMTLNKARRPSNSPGKVPQYIFEVFVLKPTPDGSGFSILARNVSQKFCIASTRTLLREIIAREKGNHDHQVPISSTASHLSSHQSSCDTASHASFALPGSPFIHPAPEQMDSIPEHIEEIAPRVIRKRDHEEASGNREDTYPREVVKSQKLQSVPSATNAVTSSPACRAESEIHDDRSSARSTPSSKPIKVFNMHGISHDFGTPRNAFPSAKLPSLPVQILDRPKSSPPPRKPVVGPSAIPLPPVAASRAIPDATPVYNVDDYSAMMLENQGVSLPEAWFWTVLFGLFGGHYLYFNKPRMAFLYLITFGFFLFGYVKDIITLPYIVGRVKVNMAAKRLKFPVYDKVSVAECYLLLLVVGFVGGHQYRLKNYKLTVLYVCTLGVFGIGLLHDLIFLPEMVEAENLRRKQEFINEHGEGAFNNAVAFNKKFRNRICTQ